MNEKEKMLKGEVYDGGHPDLVYERTKAAQLCMQFNTADPFDRSTKETVIKQLMGHIEEPFCIEAPLHCDYGSNIHIGHHFYCNCNGTFLDCAKITIGNHVFIGPNAGLYTAKHPIGWAKRSAGEESASPITIGNHVWIGGNVTILPNVHIGDYSVIGAGSVVTKDIPSGVVAAGNPCRVIRALTKDEMSDEMSHF